MKKIIIILSVLITTATGAFAADITIDEDSSIKEKDAIISDAKKDNSTVDDAEKSEEIEKSKKSEKSGVSDITSKINSLDDDEQKIKEWAKFNSEQNYVIIDKKECSAAVYDKDGKEIERFEIGVGTQIGDDFNDTSGLLGKAKNTTPAGEFTLIPNVFNKDAYGELTFSLGAKANKAHGIKKVVALHKVPKFREKDRLKKFYDGDLANNRMSHGCINFTEKDFKEFTKYIHGGLKTYVLPEEDGNKLVLKKNDKGELELTQTKY